MKKEYLLIITPFLVLALAYGLYLKDESLLAAVVVLVYIAFIFGFDKLKINFKSKTIEIKDEHKD